MFRQRNFVKIAMIQISSVLEPDINLEQIDALILAAKAEQPELEAIVLPEVFYSMSDGSCATPYLIEADNEHYQRIQNIAMKHQLYLLGGSAATAENGKVLNRSYNFSPKGELIQFYDKINLFAVNLKEKEESAVHNESTIYQSGKDLKTFDLAGFKFGLTICFDVRFPELFRKYFAMGVNVFTVSSAFTVPTGKAHWKTLLRARAIENQAYVIACAQWGKHNEKIQTYGHSIVFDPWGDVVAELEDGEGFVNFELSIDRIKQIRRRMDMTSQI